MHIAANAEAVQTIEHNRAQSPTYVGVEHSTKCVE